MDTQAIFKAGGVGAVVVTILTLLSFTPCIGCFTWILSFLAYVGIGVLAAYWMTPPRNSGSGAKNGAIAALAAALVAGLINMVLQVAYLAVTGVSLVAQMGQSSENLSPEQLLAALRQTGIDPTTGFGIIAGIVVGYCLLNVLIAAGLGALGGYFWGNSHLDFEQNN